MKTSDRVQRIMAGFTLQCKAQWVYEKEIRLSDACELGANNHIFCTTLPLFGSIHEDSVLADM